jgi:predicted metal-dependent peptidase
MFLIPGSTTLLLMPVAPDDQLSVFQAAFRETWQRIPETDRVTMTAYWGQNGQRAAGVFIAWPFTATPAAAAAPEEGRRLYFNPNLIFKFPEPDWLGLTIAHELAHVWLFATGDAAHLARRPKDPAEVLAWDAPRERRVWETLKRWGFDMARHDAVIEYVTRLPSD